MTATASQTTPGDEKPSQTDTATFKDTESDQGQRRQVIRPGTSKTLTVEGKPVKVKVSSRTGARSPKRRPRKSKRTPVPEVTHTVPTSRHGFNFDSLEPVTPTDVTVRSLTASYSPHIPPQVEDISFNARAGELTSVIGPSGTGKTTLVRALVGQLQFDGEVRFGGVKQCSENCRSIQDIVAIVPQANDAESDLPLRLFLDYLARTRLGYEQAEERQAQVGTILQQLGLSNSSETAVSDLSGGQRRRVAVAEALLAKARVIFLDEPTSGLDPESEVVLVDLLVKLAEDTKRTIVMITHSPAAVMRSHSLLVLNKRPSPNTPAKGWQQRLKKTPSEPFRGAGVAFYGEPVAMLKHFRGGNVDNVYRQLSDKSTDWVSAWSADPQSTLSDSTSISGTISPSGSQTWADGLTQGRAMLMQQLHELVRNRQTLSGVFFTPVVIVAILFGVLGFDNLTPDGKAIQYLGFVAVAVTFPGILAGSQEIVREVPLLRRRLSTGMNPLAYIFSKLLYLLVLGFFQALTLTAAFVAQGGGPDGALTFVRSLDILLILIAAAWASAGLGLAISAWVPNEKTLVALMPLVIVVQILLSGAFLDVEALGEAVRLMPASSAFEGLASANDLANISERCRKAVELGDGLCSSTWEGSGIRVMLNVAANWLACVIYLGLAVLGLRLRHHKRF